MFVILPINMKKLSYSIIIFILRLSIFSIFPDVKIGNDNVRKEQTPPDFYIRD